MDNHFNPVHVLLPTMKYRTRSTAASKLENKPQTKIMENQEVITVKAVKKNCDSKEKVFVRKDLDIDFSGAFKKDIIGENGIKFVMTDGEVVETNRFLLCITSSMVDTLLSLIPCCTTSTIVMPDFSATALNSLLELMTSGTTAENNLDKHQVEEIKNLAKELSINVSGISQSNQYYELVDSSENNSFQSEHLSENCAEDLTIKSSEIEPTSNLVISCFSESEVLLDKVDDEILVKQFSTMSQVIEDSFLDPLTGLLSVRCSESLAEVNDELVDDFFDGEDESPSSFDIGVKLNSTSNIERALTTSASVQMLNNEVGMELDAEMDFEFDEDYPEEEDWDVDPEISMDEPKSITTNLPREPIKNASNIRLIKREHPTDIGKFKENNNKESQETSEEVQVKVNSLHGMIDSFLSSFKDGPKKNGSLAVKVEEKIDVSNTSVEHETETDSIDDPSFDNSVEHENEKETEILKNPSKDPKEEVQEEHESNSDIATEVSIHEFSSVTLNGSDLQDESSQILIDGKYQCMFCESVYSKSRGLFNHCSSEHFHDEIKVKFGHLISSGRCNLCNKKVKVSNISQHLGSIHRKVNDMMLELGLPLIPGGDDTKNNLSSQDASIGEEKEDELEETKQDKVRTTRSKIGKLDVTSSENKAEKMLKEIDIKSNSLKKLVVKHDSKEDNESISESKLDFKHIKLPSRLKISQVIGPKEDQNYSKQSKLKDGIIKEAKGGKTVSFDTSGKGKARIISGGVKQTSILKDHRRVNQTEILPLTELGVTISEKEKPTPFTLKDDKPTPITLKFGKSNSIGKKEQTEIKQILLPPNTYIRFENKSEIKGKTVEDAKSALDKKTAIQSSLREIEARLKVFDSNMVKEKPAEKNVEILQKEDEGKENEELSHNDLGVKDLNPHYEIKNPFEDINLPMHEEKEEKKSDETEIKFDQPISMENRDTVVTNDVSVNLKMQSEVFPQIEDKLNEEIHDPVVESKKEVKKAIDDNEIKDVLKIPTDTDVIADPQQTENTVMKPVECKEMPTKTTVAKSPRKEALLSESQINYFNCPLCIFIVDKKITLREHLSIVHYKDMLLQLFTEPGSKLQCKVCKKNYNNENHLSRHIGSNHKKLKEITSVHSKVYSVDNSKLPSSSERFPCLACIKCKADSCLKCIACMEMKVNPKVTDAICFKTRCSSPISEAEYEVMKLTMDVKIEPEPFDVKIEPVETFETPALVKTETVEVSVESVNPDDQHAPSDPARELASIEKETVGISENQLDTAEFLPKSLNISVKKHSVKTSSENAEIGFTDVKIRQGDITPTTESMKGNTNIDVIEKTILEESSQQKKTEKTIETDKKRKTDQGKSNTKRSKSNPSKLTIEKTDINFMSDECSNFPKSSPVDKSSASTISTDPIAKPLINKELISSPAIPNRLTQLKAVLGTPVIKPKSTLSKELKKDVLEMAKKTTVKESNKHDKSPVRSAENISIPSSDNSDALPVLKCFKCLSLFSSRSDLYQHYSVKHFYSHIIKTFKPQEICPIPSCNVAINKENIWVSHVGAKHNIVEGFIPKEHRISVVSEVKANKSSSNPNNLSKEIIKPNNSPLTKPVLLKRSEVAQKSLKIAPSIKRKIPEAAFGQGNTSPGDGSYRWWQDLGGDLLKGLEKKEESSLTGKKSDKLTKSKLKEIKK